VALSASATAIAASRPRGQAHPGRLVLDQHPPDAESGREGGYLGQGSGRVTGQPGVEGPCLGCGRHASPVPGGGMLEPRRAPRGQARRSDHPTTMPPRLSLRLAILVSRSLSARHATLCADSDPEMGGLVFGHARTRPAEVVRYLRFRTMMSAFSLYRS
jgi:hypothetical protein